MTHFRNNNVRAERVIGDVLQNVLQDIAPLAIFLGRLVSRSLKGKQVPQAPNS